MDWKIALGAAFALTHFTFIGSLWFCIFYIDRKKVAEAEYFIPVGYMLPPRKFLKEGGLKFATIRFYSFIISTAMLFVLLNIDLQ